MAHYYIFKTNHLTGLSTPICNGGHDTMEECRLHWQAYMYGFMDGATELLGGLTFGLQKGSREFSFVLTYQDKVAVEYFMIFDDEGSHLIQELAKAGIKSVIDE